MATYQEVYSAIAHGDFTNEQLNCLVQAMQYRRARLAASNKRELQVGAVVTFEHPKQNRTYTGKVVAIKRKNVVVLTTCSDNRWLRVDTRFNVPAHMLNVAV